MLGRMGLLYRSDEAVEYEGDAAARMTKQEKGASSQSMEQRYCAKYVIDKRKEKRLTKRICAYRVQD